MSPDCGIAANVLGERYDGYLVNHIWDGCFFDKETFRHNPDHDTNGVMGGAGYLQTTPLNSEMVGMYAGCIDEEP